MAQMLGVGDRRRRQVTSSSVRSVKSDSSGLGVTHNPSVTTNLRALAAFGAGEVVV